MHGLNQVGLMLLVGVLAIPRGWPHAHARVMRT